MRELYWRSSQTPCSPSQRRYTKSGRACKSESVGSEGVRRFGACSCWGSHEWLVGEGSGRYSQAFAVLCILL